MLYRNNIALLYKHLYWRQGLAAGILNEHFTILHTVAFPTTSILKISTRQYYLMYANIGIQIKIQESRLRRQNID